VVHLSPLLFVLHVAEFFVSTHFPPESVKPPGHVGAAAARFLETIEKLGYVVHRVGPVKVIPVIFPVVLLMTAAAVGFCVQVPVRVIVGGWAVVYPVPPSIISAHNPIMSTVAVAFPPPPTPPPPHAPWLRRYPSLQVYSQPSAVALTAVLSAKTIVLRKFLLSGKIGGLTSGAFGYGCSCVATNEALLKSNAGFS